jgi:phage/plasmid-like protein (TIGR03299 family)
VSHELEFFDGTAAFVGREPAWHRLGTVIEDLTFDEAMEKAYLANWNVRVVPNIITIDDVDITVPDSFVTVRDNPATGDVEALAAVGADYEPVQLEQSFAIGSILEEMGAKVETAGSIRGGRQAFMALSMERGFILDPEGADDRVQGILNLLTSHDGSLANVGQVNGFRVVCANTFDMALGEDAPRAWKVRHTANAVDRLAEAHQMFAGANGYFERLAEKAHALFVTEMTRNEFNAIVADLYPEPESKRGKTVREKRIDLLNDLHTGQGDVSSTVTKVADTAWGGFSVLTEAIDHYRKPRGGDGTRMAMEASGFITSPATVEKQRILERFEAFAHDKALASV